MRIIRKNHDGRSRLSDRILGHFHFDKLRNSGELGFVMVSHTTRKDCIVCLAEVWIPSK